MVLFTTVAGTRTCAGEESSLLLQSKPSTELPSNQQSSSWEMKRLKKKRPLTQEQIKKSIIIHIILTITL